MKNPFRLRTFTFSGTSRQIGQQHGEALRNDIRQMLDRQFSFLEKAGLSLDAFGEIFYGETRFLQAAEKWTPNLVEMARGIAESANQDFRLVFAWQLLDEMDWYLRRKMQERNPSGDNRCSVIAAAGSQDAPTILAQNADMGKSIDGAGILLHLNNTDTGLQSLTVSLPGLVGIYGMNDRSIGVCLNAMGFMMNKSSSGLGTLFVSQGILEKTSFEEAQQFVHNVPHATGEVYTVGSPRQVASYECSANRVERYLPFDMPGLACHTNHPLVNTDLELTPEMENSLAPAQQQRLQWAKNNTRMRLDSLKTNLEDLASPLTVQKAVQILSAHDDPDNPVCRHLREETEDMTNFCIVMELGAEPAMHVTSGPPCHSDFRAFRFGERWLGAQQS